MSTEITHEELVKRISAVMNKIGEVAFHLEETDSIIYSGLCNCTMEFLSRADNYNQMLEVTISQFRQFCSHLDEIRKNEQASKEEQKQQVEEVLTEFAEKIEEIVEENKSAN